MMKMSMQILEGKGVSKHFNTFVTLFEYNIDIYLLTGIRPLWSMEYSGTLRCSRARRGTPARRLSLRINLYFS